MSGASNVMSRSKPNKPNKRPAREIYARPLPLQIHPLPTLTPQNPLSLLHIAYVLLSELVWPPSSHNINQVISSNHSDTDHPRNSTRDNVLIPWRFKGKKHERYLAYYDDLTQSVHVTDQIATRALWEQGFFGKGSLSRSEPEWIARQEARQRKAESVSNAFSEVLWNPQSPSKHGNGDLPKDGAARNGEVPDDMALWVADALLKRQMMGMNGSASKHHNADTTSAEVTNKRREERKEEKRQRAKREAEALEEQLRVEREQIEKKAAKDLQSKEAVNQLLLSPQKSSSPLRTPELKALHDMPNGVLKSPNSISRVNSLDVPNGDESGSRRPSVRFAPEVETIPGDIIERSLAEETSCGNTDTDTPATTVIDRIIDPPKTHIPSSSDPLLNQEHLQLSCVEAFFLVYALGILTVLTPETNAPLPTRALFNIFRRISYSPPLPIPQDTTFSPLITKPDDPFLISYVVYHHFRSLGWVVRPGVKFAVDFLLYNRGPVFSHAEFAVLILPSYSHPYWSSEEQRDAIKKKEQKDWWWLHCANRVQNQVRKSLVLVYVDIPPPKLGNQASGPFDAQVHEDYDVGALLRAYKIREFVVGRWSMNRNRD